MRSSFIDWLLEQQHRPDRVGTASRWLSREMNDGFDPIELEDIAIRAKNGMKDMVIESFLEFGIMLSKTKSKVSIIDDKEIDKEKLKRAVREEKYEEAAKLRDKINGNKDDEKKA